MRTLWRVKLILAPNRLILNREYTLINILKALASVNSVWSPYNFLIEDYTEIYYTIYKWNVPSIQCRMGLRWSTYAREATPLSLILIYFNIPALTWRLHFAETAPKFPDKKPLLSNCHIQTGVVGNEGSTNTRCLGGIIYIHDVQGRGEYRTFRHPSLHFPWGRHCACHRSTNVRCERIISLIILVGSKIFW
jgi:hypothetical protein